METLSAVYDERVLLKGRQAKRHVYLRRQADRSHQPAVCHQTLRCLGHSRLRLAKDRNNTPFAGSTLMVWRVNTVFRLSHQAWILLAIAGALGVPDLVAWRGPVAPFIDPKCQVFGR